MVEKIKQATEDRGALMLEAIALLGLMTMMSPMVVRQTADRSAEMEEVAVAGQMKTLRDAVSSYIDANYAGISGWTGDAKILTTDELRAYLPPSFIQSDGSIGNKLIDNYKIAVRRERPCADLSKDECNRYKITGLISSGLNTATGGNNLDKMDELDDRRAARIATMIGADGGYIRSSKSIDSLYAGADAEAQAKKIIGAQGVWEIDDVNKFFPDGGWKPGNGRVVATTTYSSGMSGDFLYRHAVNGLPDANSMFTTLDMSGNGTGNHWVKGSGGMEVIGGKLLVKSAKTVADGDSETQVGATEVKTTGYMESKGGAAFSSTNGGSMSVDKTTGNVALSKGSAKVDVQDGLVKTAVSGVSQTLNSSSWKVDIGSMGQSIDSGGQHNITAVRTTIQDTGDFSLTSAGGDIKITSQGAAKSITIESARNAYLWGGNSTGQVQISANEAFVTGTTRSKVEAGYNSLEVSNAKTYQGMSSRVVGGLDVREEFGMTDSNDTRRLYAKATRDTTTFSLNNSSSASDSGYNDVRLTSSGNSTLEKGGSLLLGQGGKRKVYINSYDPSGSADAGLAMYDSGDKQVIKLRTSQPGNGGATFIMGNGVGEDVNNQTITMTARKSKIEAGIIEPRIVRTNTNDASPTYGFPVRSQLRVSYSDTGTTTSPDSTGTAANSETFGTIPADMSGLAYNYHTEDATKYNRYRVDPAFISVMNDIKVTSRGGARLSEMLPNYINKGIYVLSNNYGAGAWPCGSTGLCSFTIPKLSKPGGGAVVDGGWEHDCGTMRSYLKGASCGDSGNGITVNMSGGYTDCGETACLTHPFMGVVPAPGKSASFGPETMAAYDEGRCPDGYVPVMTLTPTVFDVGKVNFIDLNILVDVNSTEGAAYNLEYQNFTSSKASIYQPATMVRTAVDQILDGSKLLGWKIAMGTVTPTGDGSYVWNMGGIFNGRMGAIAHTYCYFNPSRFNMPNMTTKGGNLTTMDNPSL